MKALTHWFSFLPCLLLVSLATTPLAAEPSLSITVAPATSVAHTADVSLTATLSVPADQVHSYHWAHIGGSQNMGTAPTLTIAGAGWPRSPGTRTFEVTVTFTDDSQVTARQAITFTKPPPPPPPPDATLSIAVSPSPTVAHTEDVSLTATVSAHTDQVKSYRWAHIGGYHKLGTAPTLTIAGHRWPTSPGTRTFEVTVTFTDDSQVTARQAIAFTNPPFARGTTLSITVAPSATVAHTEDVSLTATLSQHADKIKSYRWAHIGGYHKLGTAQVLTLAGSDWPTSPGTRTFEVTVTFTDGTQVTAQQAIAFTTDATLIRLQEDFVGAATTVAEFVQALPAHHKSRAVFMLASQASDAEFVSSSTPRVITWGATADDLFSWGTNDESPHYDEVEFITKEYGEWVFGVIDFTASPPALSRETAACLGCHVHGHPIWGSHYNWPGAVDDRTRYNAIQSAGDPRMTQIGTAGHGIDMRFVPIEMEQAVAMRHGEVLAESILLEDAPLASAKGLLCPKGRSTTLEHVQDALEARFPFTHWPYAMGAADGTVRNVVVGRPVAHQSFYYYENSDSNLYDVMALYLLTYLVEEDAALLELYEGLANEDSVVTYSSDPDYSHKYLHYAPGTATALDELESRVDIFFNLKGLANLNYRESMYKPDDRRHQIVLHGGHLQAMIPQVCRVLYP